MYIIHVVIPVSVMFGEDDTARCFFLFFNYSCPCMSLSLLLKFLSTSVSSC